MFAHFYATAYSCLEGTETTHVHGPYIDIGLTMQCNSRRESRCLACSMHVAVCYECNIIALYNQAPLVMELPEQFIWQIHHVNTHQGN